MSALLIHYHELALKGKNRRYFEDRLLREIQKFLGPFKDSKIKKIAGRMIVETEGTDLLALQKIISRLPGIANSQIVDVYPADLKTLCDIIPPQVPAGKGTFAIRGRRDAKHYPFTSADMGREIGSAVNVATGRPVDLSHPTLEICVEIASNKAYVGIGPKVNGFRGLPSGVSGKALTLLSGGFDSPVAFHLMQCRGLEVHGIHFHSAPMVSRASIDKVKELCEVLSLSQSKLKLALVPIVDFQKQVVAHCPDPLRILLYRRFMLRLAGMWAQRLKAKVLINGDSLGQVASQTIENITAISDIARRPIFRPLIGMSKEMILDIAKKIGTEDISKLPHDDCCGFLMPQKPAIKATIGQLEEAEAKLDIPELCQQTFSDKEIFTYECGKLKKE